MFKLHHIIRWKRIGKPRFGIERRFYLGEWVITRIYFGNHVIDFHRYAPEYWQ